MPLPAHVSWPCLAKRLRLGPETEAHWRWAWTWGQARQRGVCRQPGQATPSPHPGRRGASCSSELPSSLSRKVGAAAPRAAGGPREFTADLAGACCVVISPQSMAAELVTVGSGLRLRVPQAPPCCLRRARGGGPVPSPPGLTGRPSRLILARPRADQRGYIITDLQNHT